MSANLGWMLATALLFVTSACALPDHGYAIRTVAGDAPAVFVEPGAGGGARARGRIRIAAVGQVPAFDVALREPIAEPRRDEQPGRNVPLFVMADTHGEYEIAVALLRAQGIVDAQLHWSFGRGHMVVLGDIVDRGEHQTELLWLLYKLQLEARRAGGALHVLLGNHEVMNLRGDLRYLNPKYEDTAKALGMARYSEVLGSDSLLGIWLRGRPAILRLGEDLFVHGGISAAVTSSGLDVDALNAAVRACIDVPSGASDRLKGAVRLACGSDGPLWYRGYFALDGNPAAASAQDVEASLARFGVQHIFVGHTIVEQVTPLFGGRIAAVQVYPHRAEASGEPIMSAALRRNGCWYVAGMDGGREPLALAGALPACQHEGHSRSQR